MMSTKALRLSALLAVALVSMATSGFAQTEFKGKFTLASTAYWGNVELEPGEYSMYVLGGHSPQWVRIIGQGREAIIPAMTAESKQTSDRRSLTLVNVDGRSSVRELEAGDIGLVLTYRLPKASAVERARAEKVKTQIPISRPGK